MLHPLRERGCKSLDPATPFRHPPEQLFSALIHHYSRNRTMEYTLPTSRRESRRPVPRWADARRRALRFRMLLVLPIMMLLAFFPAAAQLSNYYQFSTTL